MAPVDFAKHRVYTRQLWSDDWELATDLYADQVVFCASPDLPSAVLHWRYGEVMGYSDRSLEDREPKDLRRHYVKIEIWPADDSGISLFDNPGEEAPDPIVWYGVIVDDDRDLDGDHGEDKPAGAQTLHALGLEFLLEREILDTSIVKSASGNQTIGRAIGFNLGGGGPKDKEFTANGGGVGDDGASYYIFHNDLSAATVKTWNAYTIIRYLLKYHGPGDVVGIQHIEFLLAFSPTTHLQNYEVALQAHGRTLKSILDELMPRSRASGWRIKVNDDVGTIVVEPFTFNAEDLDLPDGTTIPASTRTKTLTTNDDPQITGLRVRRTAVHGFQRVLARGERRGSVVTFNASAAAEWERDYATALESTYNTGATGSTAYAALTSPADDEEKNELNEAYRASVEFERVYKYFRVPPTWNGRVQSGLIEVFPEINSLGELNTASGAPFYFPGLRFEPFLPLFADVDYSAVSEPADISLPAGAPPERLRPLVWIQDPDTSRWHPGDTIPPHDEDADGPARRWQLALQVQENKLGVILRVRGDVQHAIAADDFTAADDVDAAWQPRMWDWRDTRITGYILHDDHVQAAWPASLPPNPADVFHTLVIDVPGHHLDYLVPGTILDVDDEGAQIAAAGGLVRDDRDKLRTIARLAFDWYGQPRQILEYTRRRLDTQADDGPLEIGDLITELNPADVATKETIDTVVTEIRLDLRGGTTTIKTSHAELDVT